MIYYDDILWCILWHYNYDRCCGVWALRDLLWPLHQQWIPRYKRPEPRRPRDHDQLAKKNGEEIFQSSNQHQPTRLAVVLFMIPPRFHHVSMKSKSHSSTSKARPWLDTVLPAACGAVPADPGHEKIWQKKLGNDGLGGFLLSLMCQGAINISVSNKLQHIARVGGWHPRTEIHERINENSMVP